MPKKTNKKEKRILDEVWKRNVKVRDDYTCQICKKKVEKNNCHAHHILPKQLEKYRWDINNGITLCYPCHKVGRWSAHMNAVWFAFWLKTNKNKQFWYIVEKLKEIGRSEKPI